MLRNGKGFSLPEMFLALTVLFMLCLFFIPAYTHLLKQLKQLDEEKLAIQVLYEYLEGVLVEDKGKENFHIEKEGILYQVKWNTEKEICIYHENNFQRKQFFCEIYYK
ncbi:type II secretion system protein [Niallia sp. NCCP-28]|uniref:type II secretion system protein n=1 Tax=Niallia sp. NCCP-28 TaxID=2934712 RepID=UPI0020889BA4|nr:type II secretion system protein [Niallia sp. NCCP-28]GKU81170.1 hypothetical protein NCCP28_05660 [Niallia sp. NCCP-28]